MNEKTKKILKFSGIWYGISFTLSVIWCIIAGGTNLTESNGFLSALAYCVLLPICMPLAIGIVFSPAIIALYFLFKKIKNKNTRIILTAFIIPFTNLIYLFIEHFLFIHTDFEIYSIIIGACALVMLIPTALIVILCTPKSLLPLKKELAYICLLMEIFGWGLIFCVFPIISYIDKQIELSRLNRYEPLIQQIEDYKHHNGTYPEYVEDNVKGFKEFEYEHSNKEFVIKVEDHWIISYLYCSDNSNPSCQTGWHKSGYYTKVGKWTKADYSD